MVQCDTFARLTSLKLGVRLIEGSQQDSMGAFE